MGGLAALALPVPPAVGQEATMRTLRSGTEPLLSIGTTEGGSPYELFQVSGSMRLSDGSVVVMVRGHYEVRRFGADGRHLWSRGRQGGGPVEFELPELLATCSSDNRIVIYDRLNSRMTILAGDGELVDEYRLEFGSQPPYSRIKCNPAGRMAFTRFADGSQRPNEQGPYRWTMDMAYYDGKDADVTVFHSQIPGTDRYLYLSEGRPSTEGPLTWGRDVSVAPVDEGVWIGTGDGHEIRFIDWMGKDIRSVEWQGPDLEVADEHIDRYREDLYQWYEDRAQPDWRQRFEALWARRRPALPDRFPSHNALEVAGGLVWVKHFRRPGDPEHHWLAFDARGNQVARMFLPAPFVVQQLGPDWVLAAITDELGIERLVVHELVEER